jgi:hypothetical protein
LQKNVFFVFFSLFIHKKTVAMWFHTDYLLSWHDWILPFMLKPVFSLFKKQPIPSG